MNDSDESHVVASPRYTHAGAAHFLAFYNVYKDVHGYLAVAVCCLGILANITNIVVLTRKKMRTQTNLILTSLAVSDGLTMCVYLPFALHFYCLYGTDASPQRNSLLSAYFLIFVAVFVVICHTVSIYLIVLLALLRYVYIAHPARAKVLCSLRHTRYGVMAVIAMSLVICSPNFFIYKTIGHDKSPVNETVTLVVWVIGYKTDSDAQIWLCHVNFWMQALLGKLIPCVILLILMASIVHHLRLLQKRRQLLQQASSAHVSLISTYRKQSVRVSRRRANQTTVMLLVVVSLFTLTELPQGILNLLSGILPGFVLEVYDPLGDFMDILVLINTAVNFLLYCVMSKAFRETFLETFRCAAVPSDVRPTRL